MKVARQRLTDLEAEANSRGKELREARASNDELSRTLARKEEQLGSCTNEAASLKSELAAAASSLRESRRANEVCEKDLAKAREEIGAISRDLLRLETNHRVSTSMS